jgi:formylglycine-generating enzyme
MLRALARRGELLAVVLGCVTSCSLTELDYLGAERSVGLGGAGGVPSAPSGGDDTGAEPGSSGASPVAGTTSSGGQSGVAGSNAGGDAEASAGAGFGGAPDATEPPGGEGAGGVAVEPGGIVYGVLGQSCSGGLLCSAGDDCCQQLEVPGGTFQMGNSSDANAQADEKPPHATTLTAFTLDAFEVSVGRFRRFVGAYDGTLPGAGSGAHPKLAASGWRADFNAEMPASRAALEAQISCDVGGYQTWTTQAGVRDTLPMNCVSWYLAFAFCIWDGARLPTEAEWEFASAGGNGERTYPWGNEDPSYTEQVVANCQGDGVAGCSPTDLLPVGSRALGVGRYGHWDLAGSLWEWTLDHYDATFYQSIGACDDCANLAGTTPRSLRGGNFTSLPKLLRASGRASKAPRTTDPYAGFRCARSP